MRVESDGVPSAPAELNQSEEHAQENVLGKVSLVLGLAGGIVAILVSSAWAATATIAIAALLASFEPSRWRRPLIVVAVVLLLVSTFLFAGERLASSTTPDLVADSVTRDDLDKIEEKIDQLLEKGVSETGVSEVKPLIVQWINGYRGHEGLTAYNWEADGGVDSVAQNWADTLTTTNFSHNPNRSAELPPGWKLNGENIAYNSTWQAALESFARSKGHAANMTSAKFDTIGVGVSSREATTFFVLVFVDY